MFIAWCSGVDVYYLEGSRQGLFGFGNCWLGKGGLHLDLRGFIF